MAEEDLENEEVGGDGEPMMGEDGEMMDEPKKGGKKKLIIIIVVLLLVIGGAAAAFFTGLLDPLLGPKGDQAEGEQPVEEIAAAQTGLFLDLPEMLVNLNTAGRKARYLKIRMALEIGSEADREIITNNMTRVIDNFQVYLRELRIEDLQGSAGVYRLREELLRRVIASAAPATVNDVLFREMLVE